MNKTCPERRCQVFILALSACGFDLRMKMVALFCRWRSIELVKQHEAREQTCRLRWGKKLIAIF